MPFLQTLIDEQQALLDQPYYQAGEAAVFLSVSAAGEKVAGDPVLSYAMSGKLYMSQSGWLLLSVPNALGRGVFDTLRVTGAELPTRDTNDPEAAFNAHITVMSPDEIEALGGPGKITERGHDFHYTTGPLREMEPAGWKDVSRVWAIEVQSPELKNLRKSYGLEPLRKGYEFHITVGIRRSKVHQHNDVAKFDVDRNRESSTTKLDKAAFDLAGLGQSVVTQGGNALDMLKNKWQGINPQTRGDILTAAGTTGVGAGLSAMFGALGAEPGYRAEAAKRDAFSGALGGLAGFAALKGSQLFNQEATDPVQAATAGVGATALTKMLYGSQWPLERAIFGRPSWDVMPEDLEKAIKDKEDRARRRAAASHALLPLAKQASTPPPETGYGEGIFKAISTVADDGLLDVHYQPISDTIRINVGDWAGDSGKYETAVAKLAANVEIVDEAGEPDNTWVQIWPDRSKQAGYINMDQLKAKGHGKKIYGCGHTDTCRCSFNSHPALEIHIEGPCDRCLDEEEKSAGLREDLTEALIRARAATDTNPSDEQKAAGNYAKGKLTLHGLPLSIETPKGATRSGKDKSGKAWSIEMAHDYGYIRRTESEADGDHVDIFIGPSPESHMVFVVDQIDPATGEFDEHKCMLGFKTKGEAEAGYRACYDKNWKGLQGIRSMHIYTFRRWLESGDTGSPAVGQKLEKAAIRNSLGSPSEVSRNSPAITNTTNRDTNLTEIPENSQVLQLLAAKQESDRRNYKAKHHILQRLTAMNPAAFKVDSQKGGIVGLTHQPSGFRMHAPRNALSGLAGAV